MSIDVEMSFNEAFNEKEVRMETEQIGQLEVLMEHSTEGDWLNLYLEQYFCQSKGVMVVEQGDRMGFKREKIYLEKLEEGGDKEHVRHLKEKLGIRYI